MLAGIAVLVLFPMLGASWKLASYVVEGRRQTLEEAMEWQSGHYDTSFYDTLEKTDFTVSGYGDYVLHAQELKNPVDTDRYVILSHGYTDNRLGSLKYVPLYLDLGYNCVLYDLRGHGENEPATTTYGILESQDLIRMIEAVRTRHPELSRLGLHGESLGASTTITALQYHPAADFVVADCGFSDIDNVLRSGYRGAKLPEQLADLADLGTRIRYRYALKAARPIDALSGNRIPILFLHGAEDTFILPRNAQDLYDRAREAWEAQKSQESQEEQSVQGGPMLRLIPGAGHAESILKAPDLYRQAVEEFLRANG